MLLLSQSVCLHTLRVSIKLIFTALSNEVCTRSRPHNVFYTCLPLCSHGGYTEMGYYKHSGYQMAMKGAVRILLECIHVFDAYAVIDTLREQCLYLQSVAIPVARALCKWSFTVSIYYSYDSDDYFGPSPQMMRVTSFRRLAQDHRWVCCPTSYETYLIS